MIGQESIKAESHFKEVLRDDPMSHERGKYYRIPKWIFIS
jgi:hypothetical protein